MRLRSLLLSILTIAALAVPSSALAQSTFITPYVGSSFNSTIDEYDFGTKLHYGAALTWLGRSGLGFEVDLGYAPTFFEPGDDEFFNLDSRGNVTTVMGNLVLGATGGGLGYNTGNPYGEGTSSAADGGTGKKKNAAQKASGGCSVGAAGTGSPAELPSTFFLVAGVATILAGRRKKA